MPSAGDQSDFQLVDAVFNRLADKKNISGVHSLTRPERIVYFTWAALGLLENGSFQYFFENEMDAKAVAESFSLLGLSSLADLVQDANEKFSELGHSNHWDEKLQSLEQNEAFFDSLARQIVQSSKDIEGKLGAYIRSKPNFFQRT
jgi:hypothetical protein